MKIIVIVGLLFIYLTMRKNGALIKRSKQARNYIACTNAIFANDEDVLGVINNYIASEQVEEFINKARILKAYVELEQEIDPSSTLKDIDLHDLVYTNNKIDAKKFMYNSDTYVWAVMTYVRAYAKNDEATMQKLYDILNKEYDVINGDLCIHVFNNIAKALSEKDEEAISFLKRVQEGEYAQYIYDKQIIGFYKYLSLTTLAYLGEPLSEEALEDMHTFADMKVGKFVMKDLGIYDTYYVPEVEDAEEEAEDLEDEALALGSDDAIDVEANIIEEVIDEVKEKIEDIKEEIEDKD